MPLSSKDFMLREVSAQQLYLVKAVRWGLTSIICTFIIDNDEAFG